MYKTLLFLHLFKTFFFSNKYFYVYTYVLVYRLKAENFLFHMWFKFCNIFCSIQ